MCFWLFARLLFSAQNFLLFSVLQFVASFNGRLKMQMHWIQVDNQLPFVLMPVLFCPQRMENQSDYIIKFSMTLQTNNSLEFCVYPYLGVQVICLHGLLINLILT